MNMIKEDLKPAVTRVTDETLKLIKMASGDEKQMDFLANLVIEFNYDMETKGFEKTLIGLLGYGTKRKKQNDDKDKANLKSTTATLMLPLDELNKFKSNCQKIELTQSEVIRRMVNKRLAEIIKE